MIFSCIKFIFIFLNTLFWGLSHTSILLIVVGIIVSLLVFLGSIGAWSDSRLLLGLFTGFRMLILSLQIVSGILFYVFRNKVERRITLKAKEVIMKHSPRDKVAIDDLQDAFHCCGAENYTDWLLQSSHGNISVLPHSCCHVDSVACVKVVTTDNIYQRGCVQVIKEYLKRNLVWLGAACIVLGLIELVGCIMGMKLFRDVKKREVYENFS